jgi:cold shock CspA family protein
MRQPIIATGTVKWFDPNRGYGFVHVSAVQASGLQTLQGRKGPQAANLRPQQANASG